ncbi:MAG: hypothetical protein E7324_00625 [Clostridiales bacterium]|nr:hypothetical protein [Clostridiales bacterium]
MTQGDMVNILEAKVLCGAEHLDKPVYTAFCSDLMSDVLAFVNEKTVLITGLVNPHVVRTADMLDLKCIIFCRGKMPSEAILSDAEDLGMTVMTTRNTAFTTCGLLYEAGLRGVPIWSNKEDDQ